MNENDQLQSGRSFAFIQVEHALIDRDDIDVFEMGVYMVLCRYENRKKGTAFPSASTIAKKLGVSVRKVQYTVTKLVEKGLITKRTVNNNLNIYTLQNVPEIAKNDENRGAPDAGGYAPRAGGYAPRAEGGAPRADKQYKTNTTKQIYKTTTTDSNLPEENNTPLTNNGTVNVVDMELSMKDVGIILDSKIIVQLFSKYGSTKMAECLDRYNEIRKNQNISNPQGFYITMLAKYGTEQEYKAGEPSWKQNSGGGWKNKEKAPQQSNFAERPYSEDEFREIDKRLIGG